LGQTRYCPRCLNTFQDDLERCSNLACGRARPGTGWGYLLHPGDVLDRHYLVEKALAVGGAGITYQARELGPDGAPLGPDLAIKVLYAQRDQGAFLKRLATEAQILQELAHDNIVECRGFVQRSGQAPYLVTLFEHGGNLGEHLERCGPLAPRIAGGILRQILLALDTAHQRAIVHRDLKPENVLLRSPVPAHEVPHVRVADFGIAKVQAFGERMTRHGSFVGTPEFAAPEQFLARAPTPATDVYAAGAVFFTLLTGADPVRFDDRTDIERCHAEILNQLPPRLPAGIGEGPERELLQRLLDSMMQVDPDRRTTIHPLLVVLDELQRGQPREALRTLGTAETQIPRTLATVDLGTDVPEDEDERPVPSPDPGESRRASGWWWLLPAASAVLSVGCAGVSVPLGWLALALWNQPPSEANATQLAPIVLQPPPSLPPARDLGASTDPADRAENQRLVQVLGATASDLQSRCGLNRPLVADVRVDADGRVRDVAVRGDLPVGQRWCVQRTLRGVQAARTTPGEVSMRVTVSFGG
jgi:serine/threonine protein kinase